MGHALRTLAGIGISLAAVASTGCQDVRAFVTGDPVRLASENAPRVEVEVFVDFKGEFLAPFEDAEEVEELKSMLHQRVLDLADLGLRFYPIPTDEYEPGQVHPERMFVVTFDSLTIGTEHETIEEHEAEPRVESSVVSVRCEIKAAVGRRRANAPTLIIGRMPGEGRVKAKALEPDDPRYALRPRSDEVAPPVKRSDLIAAADEALVAALRDLVEPVDRELAAAAGE